MYAILIEERDSDSLKCCNAAFRCEGDKVFNFALVFDDCFACFARGLEIGDKKFFRIDHSRGLYRLFELPAMKAYVEFTGALFCDFSVGRFQAFSTVSTIVVIVGVPSILFSARINCHVVSNSKTLVLSCVVFFMFVEFVVVHELVLGPVGPIKHAIDYTIAPEHMPFTALLKTPI
jgi:hypothetical protein